jgi:hypothetical protein
MMTRDDKSAVIFGLRKRHRLLAAFLEAAERIGPRRMVIGGTPEPVNVEACQPLTAPQSPEVAPPPAAAFSLRRANLVALAQFARSPER